MTNDNISAITSIRLSFPYVGAISILVQFTNLWGIKLLKSSTASPFATISIPSKKFKILFSENPRVGSYNIPMPMRSFAKEIKVESIKIQENHNGSDSKSTKSKVVKRKRKIKKPRT